MIANRIVDVVGAIINDGDRYLCGQQPANKSQMGAREFAPADRVEITGME